MENSHIVYIGFLLGQEQIFIKCGNNKLGFYCTEIIKQRQKN